MLPEKWGNYHSKKFFWEMFWRGNKWKRNCRGGDKMPHPPRSIFCSQVAPISTAYFLHRFLPPVCSWQTKCIFSCWTVPSSKYGEESGPNCRHVLLKTSGVRVWKTLKRPRLTISSSAHLSAVLTHIGLASHNRPDVVIETPAEDKKKEELE